MAGNVKTCMQGFLTEARSNKKNADKDEAVFKELRDNNEKLSELVIVKQQETKNLDVELDRNINEYHDARSKKEKAMMRFNDADTTMKIQKGKFDKLDGVAEKVIKQVEEVQKKLEACDEIMLASRKGLKEVHFNAVRADKEVNLKQSEIKAAL